MSAREKYKILKLRSEIENFQVLIETGFYDEAVRYFRAHLDKPTLYGLETSLERARLLRKIKVEKLSKDEDKTFVLYSLALTLNLTGGYPNRAIPLYENHNLLAEKCGDHDSLSRSLGHHAKALRQVGRFFESEIIARRGLKIIRERKDFMREAVNLYWLGMGLAHRGEARLSEIALQRSLRIFKAKFAVQSEGVVNAFLAQRALWLGDCEEAFRTAGRAFEIGLALEADENHADLHGAVKILIAGARMKGEALVLKNDFDEGEKFLLLALRRAREIEFVEEELPALRVLALKSLRAGEFEQAKNYLRQTRHLAERGRFLLYDADSYNISARIEIALGNFESAFEAAEKAFCLSVCDGVPFVYRRGIEEASVLLEKMGKSIPAIPILDASEYKPVTKSEINPADEFEDRERF